MAFLAAVSPRSAPLHTDADGVVRVGATRVTLDTIVGAYQNGCTAEEIATKYPSLDLADIYGVIAHYLWNRAEIDAYIAERAAEGETRRMEADRRSPSSNLRDQLLARRRIAS